MKKFKKIIRALPAFMLVCVLLLTGCQNKTGDLDSSVENDTQTSNIDAATTDELGADGEVAIKAGEYESKVFDRSLTEGKLAVYAFRADNGYVYDASSQHAGDSMLIVSPDGKTMLIDMNCPSNTSIVVDSLQKLGIEKLDYLVLSHQHLDHLGAYSIIFRYMEIEQIITNAHEYVGSNTYEDLHKLIDEYEIPCSYAYEGDTIMLGEDVEIKVYNPPEGYDYVGGTDGQNNGSLLLKVIYGDSSFLFGGDLYAEQEEVILAKYADELKVDVAKMNHHGYSTSNTKNWVRAVSPKIAFAQMSGVVEDTIVGRYQVVGAAFLHTALDGPFVIYTDGDGVYDVQVSQDRWLEDFGVNEMENGHMTVE